MGETRLFEVLSGSSHLRIRNRSSFWLAWIIDVCANHADNRQAIFIQDDDRSHKAFFVDHGHLFGGPSGGVHKGFVASRYLDPHIYDDLPLFELSHFKRVVSNFHADTLWRMVHGLPDDWKTVSGLGCIARALERLSNPKLLDSVVDTLVDAHRRFNCRGPREIDDIQGSINEVLHFGVQSIGPPQ